MGNVLVQESSLSAIANAIRAKKSTEDTYKPSEMAGAISTIPTGTAPTGTKSVTITANGTTTEDVTNYASAEITVNVQGSGGYTADDWGDPTKPTGEITITKAYATNEGDSSSYMFARRSGITTVHMPNTTYLPHNYFIYSSLSKLDAPLLEEAGASSIQACYSLTDLVLPKFRNSRNNGSFMTNTNLVHADFGGSAGGATMANLFAGCSKLNLLILRASNVWTLTNINAFNNTPFASGKAGGTLYVPQALVAEYQAANNWSTILGYATNQILSIEGSIYETQYADGTPISS